MVLYPFSSEGAGSLCYYIFADSYLEFCHIEFYYDITHLLFLRLQSQSYACRELMRC